MKLHVPFALAFLTISLGCQPTESPSGVPTPSKVVANTKPGEDGTYSIRQVQPGDRWEWKWEGSGPVNDGRKNVPGRGSEVTWITDGESRRPSGIAGRLVVSHFESRVDGDEHEKRAETIMVKGSSLTAISESGVSKALESEVEIGAVPGKKSVVSDDPGATAVRPGQVEKGETKYTDGSVARWKTTYGDVKRITVKAGTFTCLTFKSETTNGDATFLEEGFYCPAIGANVKYTWTQSSPDGTHISHYELVSTNVDPADEKKGDKK